MSDDKFKVIMTKIKTGEYPTSVGHTINKPQFDEMSNAVYDIMQDASLVEVGKLVSMLSFWSHKLV